METKKKFESSALEFLIAVEEASTARKTFPIERSLKHLHDRD
jgi:hypothetical protein